MFSVMRRRVTYANVTVTLALVFAMSGGAYAASKILITSTKQIKPSVLKQLQGKAGAQGPAGPAGVQGLAGPQGPAGANGKDGAPGAPGVKGEPGVEGKQGAPGLTGFTATLPEGKSESGNWGVAAKPGSFSAIGEMVLTTISFNIPLKEAPAVHLIQAGTPENEDPTGCAGTISAPQAEPGNLCVFSFFEENVGKYIVLSPETAALGAGKSGTVIEISPPEGVKPQGILAEGVWVTTAAK